ncbi:VUT family protein [Amycolatopsis sp. NPDC051371]|uniref:VUT family protein n=1 Tax=Amycolatopsis sp. NPDC051371 TaxID=3155800 RepID=UPI00343C00B0
MTELSNSGTALVLRGRQHRGSRARSWTRRPAAGWTSAGCYLAAVVGANWASSYHVLTLGGLVIPAGACIAGAAFIARDVVHEALGARGVLAAIAAGTVLSAAVATPRVALASATAFLLSELADSLLYRRWRPHGHVLAIAGSNLGGLIVDSVVFVPCAFGSLTLLPGQLAGKALTTAAAIALVLVVSRRREARS